jgi:predicted RNase H-like HicB family nuclease
MASSLTKIFKQPNLHIWVWEEDGGFIAKCLDIPGCISEGDTREEALANIYDAISLCLDVIKEDHEDLASQPENIEMIERPISDFLAAH